MIGLLFIFLRTTLFQLHTPILGKTIEFGEKKDYTTSVLAIEKSESPLIMTFVWSPERFSSIIVESLEKALVCVKLKEFDAKCEKFKAFFSYS